MLGRSDMDRNSNLEKFPRKHRRSRRQRLRERLHVNIYVLPNLLTTMNLFFGFYGIVHAVQGDYVMAAYAVVAASIFDLLDGRVARMTHSTSEFGEQYDSLSDLVSFGVAPGLLLFYWSLQPFGRLGWLASFFFVACGALRLARFNVQKTALSKAYFQGLPIPMAAGIVASAVLAFNDLELDASRSWILLAITFLLGFVMVSTFPYRSFKDLDLKERLPFRYLVFGVFIVAMIAIRPEVMLFVTFMTYALLGAIFGVLKIGKAPKVIADEVANHIDSEEDDHQEH
jgi:CDP-diacylglycerol--serine O-phosphatidyltransferase